MDVLWRRSDLVLNTPILAGANAPDQNRQDCPPLTLSSRALPGAARDLTVARNPPGSVVPGLGRASRSARAASLGIPIQYFMPPPPSCPNGSFTTPE